MKSISSSVALALLVLTAGWSQQIDRESEQAVLMRADRDWAAAASTDDVERICSYWSDDAVIYSPNFPAVAGKDALREFVTRNRSLPGFSITWQPETAVVSSSGDLGYTLGPYEITMPDPSGRPQTLKGKYLSTWRKQSGGQWKCTLEIHSPSPGRPRNLEPEGNKALLLARRLMDIWESGNTGPLAEITTVDVVYDDMPNSRRFEGRDSVRRYIEHVHKWAGQVDIEVTSLQGGETAAVAEWTMRGIQDRPIPDRVPVATNRTFELKGATLIELREGKIARATDYIDILGFVVQLGGRVELPGGVVIPSNSVDVEADRSALIETDRAWANAQVAGDMERVVSYWADDAVIIPAGMEAVRGKRAIREFVTRNQAQRGFSLRWEPQEATVSRTGEIGYTVGHYEISMEGPGGTSLVSRGRYLTAWRKDTGGAWKCTLEIHSPLGGTTDAELQMGQPGSH